MNSVFPHYSEPPPNKRVSGWVVAVTTAMIVSSTAFALWAILAAH